MLAEMSARSGRLGGISGGAGGFPINPATPRAGDPPAPHGRTRFADAMPEVDHLGFGRQGPRKVQLSAAPSGDYDVEACSAFSVSLPLSGTFRRLPSASWKETVPQAASRQEALAFLAGSQRHHDAEGDRTVLRSLGLTEFLPAFVHAQPCRVLTDGVRRSSQRTRRFPGRAVTHHPDRARPPAASGNRREAQALVDGDAPLAPLR